MTFPVTLTKGGEEAQCFHAPDLKGWLAAGWKVKGGKNKVGATPNDGLDGKSVEALQKIAEQKGIKVDSRWSAETLIEKIRG